MKFDAVIGNPPYQKPKTREDSTPNGAPTWQNFAHLALDMTNDFVAFIHPPTWRGMGRTYRNTIVELRRRMRKYDMPWLKMLDMNSSGKIFNVGIPIDCYIMRKTETEGFLTEVIGTDSAPGMINVKEMDLIPNFDFDDSEFELPLAKEGEETVEFLHTSFAYAFHRRPNGMSHEKTDEFDRPCVYSMHKDGSMSFKWANEDRGMFGIPKVIFSAWHSGDRVAIDAEGQYAMCSQNAAIADEPEILPKIAEAMRTDRFRRMMDKCRVSTLGWNRHAIMRFRKDFWKDFQ